MRLGGKVARASAGELVCIDEEPSVWVARINREHSVVDILLGTLGLVTGGEKTTSRVGEEAGLETGSLGVVVVTVSVSLRDVLEDDPPVTFNIDSTGDLSVVNVRGAKVTLRSNPVRGVIRRWSLGSSRVILVVKRLFLRLGDVLNKVISRLISNICVLLQEESILRDLVSNVISRVLLVNNTIRKI